ncbi:hypothetical protein SAMN05421823_101683 [Catalinimonas alkaloidigena]|uniref:PAP2 superfamily protein n=1 Tax=Catalinimonas alkaloidigena TaxID=1075417 RepID=A0A1G8YKF6_9BACT|nr:vanadium-dependent haloperoxidase [Catalinimonas alkaloidigena]SDK02560.1 hypothetical protein SAMN05421823_101683 [Catalinimonas alkaloidigena]
MQTARPTTAETVRNEAAKLASHRPHPHHLNNKEEYEYRDYSDRPDCPITCLASFTKGLPHDLTTGLLLNPVDYKLFVAGIQSGDPVDFQHTPLGPGVKFVTPNCPSDERIKVDSTAATRASAWCSNMAKEYPPNPKNPAEKGAYVRAWESAGAGNVFDLQGPDAQAVTMPPAPRLDSDELLGEIAELYAMALLRDLPFRHFRLPAGCSARPADKTSPPPCADPDSFDHATAFLNSLAWFNGGALAKPPTLAEAARRRTLQADGSNGFRGQTPGEQVGPYLSQFLLLGNTSLESKMPAPAARQADQGYIRYGAISIEQKVRIATPCKDYLTIWAPFIDVQNGADLRGLESYEAPTRPTKKNPCPPDGHRFITTPRDLATYVHYDALYEAYLNACIFLLSSGAPFDRGIPFLEADVFDKQQGFAHFGGPHILTLVTEVATRALKAVRYQKFNVHRRLRPEAMGGHFDRWHKINALKTGKLAPFRPIAEGLSALHWNGTAFPDVVKAHNAANNATYFSDEVDSAADSYLLPMAFPEGSPMHPSYGAGHATVAGACITILKAYFDHGWTPPAWFDDAQPVAYEPSNDGSRLIAIELDKPLTVEGELNKLAANIAIGRNWGGVHYYSDYIESIRLGEQIALGLLEEQKLCYPENFTMTVPLFDGGAVRI